MIKGAICCFMSLEQKQLSFLHQWSSANHLACKEGPPQCCNISIADLKLTCRLFVSRGVCSWSAATLSRISDSKLDTRPWLPKTSGSRFTFFIRALTTAFLKALGRVQIEDWHWLLSGTFKSKLDWNLVSSCCGWLWCVKMFQDRNLEHENERVCSWEKH